MYRFERLKFQPRLDLRNLGGEVGGNPGAIVENVTL
jgi:hypothetical protein